MLLSFLTFALFSCMNISRSIKYSVNNNLVEGRVSRVKSYMFGIFSFFTLFILTPFSYQKLITALLFLFLYYFTICFTYGIPYTIIFKKCKPLLIKLTLRFLLISMVINIAIGLVIYNFKAILEFF
jgi:hypothetical protein